MATVTSVIVTAMVFDARQWDVYIAAMAIIALTYGFIGMLIGPVFGRVSGVFIAFLLPFLDLGIAQSPMLRSQPDRWARFLPGYGGTGVLIDGALTATFDETLPLLVALAWLTAVGIASMAAFHRAVRVKATRLAGAPAR